MNDIEICKKILHEYDGNISVLYPIIADEVDHMNLPIEIMAFIGEFMCFESDYAQIRLDIQDRHLEQLPILDIGCQIGFQSAMFQDCSYYGIDYLETMFFKDHGNYRTIAFPNPSIDVKNKVIISNMSLGFFNSEENGISDESICESLKNADYLYICSEHKLCDMLKPYFNQVVDMRNNQHVYPFYFMCK